MQTVEYPSGLKGAYLGCEFSIEVKLTFCDMILMDQFEFF
jgi:hypothetical protein